MRALRRLDPDEVPFTDASPSAVMHWSVVLRADLQVDALVHARAAAAERRPVRAPCSACWTIQCAIGLMSLADDVEAESVGLEQRCAAAHERVADDVPTNAWRTASRPDSSGSSRQNSVRQQAAKNGARAPRKPLVNADDRSIALLDLFFAQRQPRRKGGVEILFDGHYTQPRCWMSAVSERGFIGERILS